MWTPLLITPLFAFSASVLLHSFAIWVFPRIGLLDFPERYGLKRARLPYPVGIIAVVLFCAFCPLILPWGRETLSLVCGILFLGITCFLDDRYQLSPIVRFGVQGGIAVLLVTGGIRVDAITNPFIEGASFDLTQGQLVWFSGLFTIAWLLFTVNALNWFDGIPGQVSTLSTIAFLTIGFLSVSERVDQPALAMVAFVLAGIALGGLFFDFPPARALMGDSGAMFYGLMIGVLTIYSGGKVATAFLVLGVPLIDLLFVIVRRISRRQSIFHGNREDQHLHHRLLKKGWSERKVIALTSLIGASFGVTALFLSTGGKVAAGVVLLTLMMGLSIYSNPKSESRNKSESGK